MLRILYACWLEDAVLLLPANRIRRVRSETDAPVLRWGLATSADKRRCVGNKTFIEQAASLSTAAAAARANRELVLRVHVLAVFN